METTSYIGVYIGRMDKKMETTIAYRGYIGMMEKKKETTVRLLKVLLLKSRIAQNTWPVRASSQGRTLSITSQLFSSAFPPQHARFTIRLRCFGPRRNDFGNCSPSCLKSGWPWGGLTAQARAAWARSHTSKRPKTSTP